MAHPEGAALALFCSGPTLLLQQVDLGPELQFTREKARALQQGIAHADVLRRLKVCIQVEGLAFTLEILKRASLHCIFNERLNTLLALIVAMQPPASSPARRSDHKPRQVRWRLEKNRESAVH